MTLPLTPEVGLFPDLFIQPFIAAPDVETVADDVIASYDEFRSIASAVGEKALSIAFVFETKPYDPDKEDFKPHTIAKVTKASPLWNCLTSYELVIQFRQAFWDVFNDGQRRAVLHHELTHVEVDEPDEQGRIALRIRHHDVEDFTLTMRRFGPIIPGRAAFVKAYLDWQHEQDRPEPPQLRRVATDDNADLRPTGEVNVDELRGAADRDSE